ncbi:unnamed protein product, partial [Larinioides sclopetarius]
RSKSANAFKRKKIVKETAKREFIKTAVKEKLTKSSADDEKRPKHLNVLDRFRTKSK